jgi:cephalosporin-C deacetylase-like acetyl esterase
MALRNTAITVRSLDGLRLAGTLVTPDKTSDRPSSSSMVVVSPVKRAASSPAWRLALGEAGVASLRYDLRGHGESDGLLQDNTLSPTSTTSAWQSLICGRRRAL